ncbi:NAD(P)H-dependent glycerol-3-phosphate dehydrogenase [Candidatus Venteria ishoeyi]|uniref:Glycerol-3-phosphate dehydrogenase [NAD(P)+] n=1 Tax=Candidatus Venteria ishoeyi TaxID=1899563 RepID=A0A1H6FA66_9GAMM|nr:NAD(P)H-dependent glycerol-3-phosphate dehydrogenase [Candidatus Venteria ishoeyi]SEH06992.1 Glycerol-3-phosphate dehydrogenase [NAD(P)+] [Candidatus Venteria ishoeyi]
MQECDFLVIGAGSWGTALAILLARNSHQVWLWGHDAAHTKELQQQRCNQRYLPEQSFPESLQAIDDLEAALKCAKHVLIVVPSGAFAEVVARIAPQLPEATGICWATKGLEQRTQQLLHQVAQQHFGKNKPMAVISGPTFAGEVAADLPTAMTIAADQLEYAESLAAYLRNAHCRVYTSTDMIGVQLGAAAKNVIAIAAGIADGMKLGANTRAALITRGLTEIMRLGVALGGQRETFMGLAGLGDLVLTCTDNQSRNRRFGYALAQGEGIQQAQQDIAQVVEGAHAAKQIVTLAQQHHIEMPISEQVNLVLQGQCTAQQAVHNLLSRDPKPEIE